MRDVLIIGAGQAGAMAARALRRHAFDGKITLIGREKHLPYERPPLSKSYLLGQVDRSSFVVLSTEQAEAERINLALGVEITNIDRMARVVTDRAGRHYSYDVLFLATGGEARILPGIEEDGERIFLLRSVDDADRLADKMAKARRMLVIGGGWLGLEIAASARAKGLEACIVEAAPSLCARAAPPQLSEYLYRLHQERGVKLHLGAGLRELKRAGDGVEADLVTGEQIEADIAVISTGLRVNDELAGSAGLVRRDGVVTDMDGRTTDRAVFAIGDCARFFHPYYQSEIRMESWGNANVQAERAVRAALGLEPEAPGIPWFWSDQFDRNIQILGHVPASSQCIRRKKPGEEKGETMLFLCEEKLRAIIAINNPREIAMARRLIASGTRVDVVRAGDPAVSLRDAAARI